MKDVSRVRSVTTQLSANEKTKVRRKQHNVFETHTRDETETIHQNTFVTKFTTRNSKQGDKLYFYKGVERERLMLTVYSLQYRA